jgi:hypothetical protein
VSREIGHSNGTGITGHEWSGVTIEWCLRERRIVVIIVTGRNELGDCEEGDAWGDSRGSMEKRRAHQENTPPVSRENPRRALLKATRLGHGRFWGYSALPIAVVGKAR